MDEFVVASAAELLQHLQLVQSWVSHVGTCQVNGICLHVCLALLRQRQHRHHSPVKIKKV